MSTVFESSFQTDYMLLVIGISLLQFIQYLDLFETRSIPVKNVTFWCIVLEG
jgi:hypothetical protein